MRYTPRTESIIQKQNEKIRNEVEGYKGQIQSIELAKKMHTKIMKIKNIFIFIGLFIILLFILYEWKKYAK